MKNVSHAVLALVVLGFAGTSVTSAGSVSSSSTESTAVEKVVRDMQANQIKLDQDTGSDAAPAVIAADATALDADQKSLKKMTGK